MIKSDMDPDMKAVIYARVSSEEQGKGYSNDAQLDLCRTFASARGLHVVTEFVDVESASSAGRTQFGRMLELLRSGKATHVIAEKTDRLLRNIHDEYALWVLIEDKGLTVHRTKEGSVNRNSTPAEKLMFRIHNILASHDTEERIDKTKKGLQKKASEGYWPGGVPPLGYSHKEVNGKKIIVPDDNAPMIRQLFETYRRGGHSLASILPVVHAWGLRTRPRKHKGVLSGGRGLCKQSIYKILSNSAYTGRFVYTGKTVQGTYEPLISETLFNEVDRVLHRRGVSSPQKHTFTLSGIVRCGHCGKLMTPQKQAGKGGKGNYVYYRCAAYCGKEKYIREERMLDSLAALLDGLTFDDEVMSVITERLHEAQANHIQERQSIRDRLRTQHDRLQSNLDRLTEAEIKATEDGRDAAKYQARMKEIQQERVEIVEQLSVLDSADTDFTEEIINLARLAQRSARVFRTMEGSRRTTFLRGFILNPTFADGELKADFASPFDLIADAFGSKATKTGQAGSDSARRNIPGGRRDLNPQPLVPQTSALTN